MTATTGEFTSAWYRTHQRKRMRADPDRTRVQQWRLRELFPELNTTLVSCPACPCSAYLGSLLIHLNDDHGWSRESIADWLETR